MTKGRQLWTDQFSTGPTGSKTTTPTTKTTARTKNDLEFQIQAGFIDWVRVMEQSQIPELENLFAIPNGGARHPAVGRKMKREGVKRGVPDLFLSVARQGKCGLYLETKAPSGRLSQWQKDTIKGLKREGYRVDVCYSIEELISSTMDYLGLE